MRKFFKTGQLIPCYTEEVRCKWCRCPYPLWCQTLHVAINNAWDMAEHLLEPMRERYGKPVRVLRCFMCHNKVKKLKRELGGTQDRNHDIEQYLLGQAADISAVAGMPKRRKGYKTRMTEGSSEVTFAENMKLVEIIKEMDFDQLVIFQDHLHVSYKNDGTNRHLVESHLRV